MPKAKGSADRVMARQWALLRALPRAPRSITVRDLMVRLGYGTKRMVERDLRDLESAFPGAIDCDDSERIHLWRWRADASILMLPAMTDSEALALKLVERFLAQYLPRSVTGNLAGQFKEAARVLGELAPQPRPTWADKLHFEPPTQPLLPPKINADAMRAILEALLRDRQASIHYKDGEKGARTINPLALIQRGPVSYLLCTFEGRDKGMDDLRLLALHRVRSAEMREVPAIAPRGFKLKDYVESGALGFGKGEKVRLEVRFLGNAITRIKDTPLSHDQEVIEEGEDRVRVRATVPLTPQLEWWLCSFTDLVEILKPESLRDKVAERLARAASQYARLKNQSAPG